MAKSLQDQLLRSGLVDNKKAKAIKQEKRKQKKKQPKGQAQVDENKARLEAERLQKIERDRELNRQREQAAQDKAIQAQIKQVIEQHRIDRERGDIGYQFAHGKKIQKIYVTPQQQEQLARGQIAIAILEDTFELVPAVIADKIAERDASHLVYIAENAKEKVEEDDPYADYQIPDDLMW